MSADAWQVLTDCPHCRTEASVVELFDPLHPAAAFGVPVDRRCRLCGWHEVAAPLPGGAGCPGCGDPSPPADTEGRLACAACGYVPQVTTTTAPADLTDPDRARAALVRWAAEEGEHDVEVFCQGGFGGDVQSVIARLTAREPVPTLFDVVDFLFGSHGGGGQAPVQRAVERTVREDDAPGDPTAVPARPPPPAEPRAGARLLASVMLADGGMLAAERRFVDQTLARHDLPGLAAEDLRVWRAADAGLPDPALREPLLEAAVHLAYLDGHRDDSEARVLRTFAAAWGVPEAKLAGWDRRFERRYGSATRRLGRFLNRVLGGEGG
ncbi:MAG: hypothetical protein R3F59_06360 [Myxococcota bacterium]